MALATTTNTAVGNIVVPLSEIVAQLQAQGKLATSDIDALLNAIVAKKRTGVYPGDLITAELINQVLRDIETLNTQVALLAGGTGGLTKNGPAVAALYDAWNAYGALAKQGQFVPTGTTPEVQKAAVEIAGYLQDIMSVALAGGALGYLGDTRALLDAFQQLYDKQHELVVLFLAPIAGIADTTEYRHFGTLLNNVLEQDNALGAVSLKKALDLSDLAGAIAAQNRITDLVRNQGGDVTTGNLDIGYLGPVGTTETLVVPTVANPNPVVLYRYSVTNKTNRTLDVQFLAEFLAPRTAWTASVSVVGVNGGALSSIPLVPFNAAKPADPAATQEVRVAVGTQAGEAAGDKGTLRLTTFVPEPIDRRMPFTRELRVDSVAAPLTPGIVAYTKDPEPSGSVGNLHEDDTWTLGFEFQFSKLNGPAPRSFTFRLDSPAAIERDLFDIEFIPGSLAINEPASSATRLVSNGFSMNDGEKRQIAVAVTMNAGSAGKSLTFTGTVESATDGILATSKSFTLSVKP